MPEIGDKKDSDPKPQNESTIPEPKETNEKLDKMPDQPANPQPQPEIASKPAEDKNQAPVKRFTQAEKLQTPTRKTSQPATPGRKISSLGNGTGGCFHCQFYHVCITKLLNSIFRYCLQKCDKWVRDAKITTFDPGNFCRFSCTPIKHPKSTPLQFKVIWCFKVCNHLSSVSYFSHLSYFSRYLFIQHLFYKVGYLSL